MRKIILAITIFMTLMLSVFAQVEPIYFDREIIYKVTYQPDSMDRVNIKTEYAELRLNDTVSVFRTIAKGKLDSVNFMYFHQGASQPPLSFYMANKTDIHHTIVKRRDSIFHFERLHNDLLALHYYSEPKDILDWTISTDTMTVQNIPCQKATVELGGRQWIAWFAQAIPIFDGPYKFSNLPGLVLSIHDTSETWRFDIVSMDLDKRGQSWINSDNYPPQQLTKDEYFSQKAHIERDIFTILLAEGRFKGVKGEALEKVKEFYNHESKQTNNGIELNP